MRVPVHNMAGEQVGEMDLNEQVFASEINEALLHQAVVMYQANRRRGVAATKTRDEVRGGGRKPWRQKGTGRARHGSIRSPLWRGGGVTFGPRPRDFRQSLPRKAKKRALVSALSAKVRDDELIIVDEVTLAEPKTRVIADMLSKLGVAGKSLLVTNGRDSAIELSSRNIKNLSSMSADSLNAYEVLAHKRLVMTQNAVKAVEEGLA